MKIIGLTGSIGMGKSTAARIFEELGVPVHDSDACVHDVLNGAAVDAVSAAFPGVLDGGTKCIDRAKLGAIVFRDADQRLKLESIIHPHVWDAQNAFKQAMQAAGKKAVVLDIPLLFETGANQRCDMTVCVSAPKFIQRQRVMRRDGMTLEKYQAICANQMSDHEKRRRADIVVQSGLGYAYTYNQIKRIVGKCVK